MKLVILTIGLVIAIPIIALFDYHLFKRASRCTKCGQELPWGYYIIPTFLEIFMFFAGIGYGTLLL
jgi:hypothetical protein